MEVPETSTDSSDVVVPAEWAAEMQPGCGDSPDCPLKDTENGCYRDDHHIYWPESDYQTETESQFRGLFIIPDFCRALHDQIHAEDKPPPKPPLEVMERAVAQHKLNQELQSTANKLRKTRKQSGLSRGKRRHQIEKIHGLTRRRFEIKEKLGKLSRNADSVTVG